MRIGLPVSIVLHAVVAGVLGYSVSTQVESQSTPMMILPIELLTISDSTNVAPVPRVEEAPVAEQPATPEDAAPDNAAPEEPAPVPEPEAEAIPEPAPAVTPPKPEPKPAPKPQPKAEPTFDDALKDILQTVPKQKTRTAPSQRSPTNLGNVSEAPRRGVGDNARMTITVGDYIRDQLIRRGCWTDQEDMPDAKRLTATIRVRFQRDGRLVEAPQLIEPSRVPTNDQPMNIFTQRAFRAIAQCTPFTVPQEYFQVQPAEYIDLVFTP